MIITKDIKYHNISFLYCYDTSDPSGKGCINEIIYKDEYQLYKYNNLNGNFIDIGGNHGICSIILSILNPKAKIYVLEPDPILIDKINNNIIINNCKNITVINKALGNGKKVILTSGNSCSGANSTIVENNNLFLKKHKACRNIEVESISFDELLNYYKINDIELLKIDCEGGEYYLYDSEKLKLSIVKNITGEFHNLSYNSKKKSNWNYKELTDYIKQYIKGNIKITYLTI